MLTKKSEIKKKYGLQNSLCDLRSAIVIKKKNEKNVNFQKKTSGITFNTECQITMCYLYLEAVMPPTG
jgi:hypothetical protein